MLEIRPETAEVVVGPRDALAQTRADRVAGELGLAASPPSTGSRVTAQIRHRHTPAPARVRAVDHDRAELEFDAPQTAITPGQAVVFYDGDVVLGGGWID